MNKCTRCDGTKKIIGMGYMKEKCPECNGVGKKADATVLLTVKDAPVVEKKKRGRKKKVVLEQTINETLTNGQE